MFRLTSLLIFFIVTTLSHDAWAYDHARDFDYKNRDTWPVIAIIIDDIGHRAKDSARAVALPGPVACAVLPHTPFGEKLALRAHAAGKEVMLHLPLEATTRNELLGEGSILIDDSAKTFRKTLHTNLQAVPHVVGINNHMGSLLTRHPGHMRWLMKELHDNGEMFFVDSVTTQRSVAYDIAREFSIPTIKRDVFLDSEQNIDAIADQFERFKLRAREKGFAVAIGHPFPETMQILEAELPKLEKLGYRLVSVRDIIQHQSRHNRGTKHPSSVSSVQTMAPKP